LQASTEAFWLADAGIERARSQLPDTVMNDTNVAMGNGTYDITSENDQCATDLNGNPIDCTDRFVITSIGKIAYTDLSDETQNSQVRGIEVLYGRYDIDNVLETKGPVKKLEECGGPGFSNVTIVCDDVEELSEFSFKSVLGLSEADVRAVGTQFYTSLTFDSSSDISGGVIIIDFDPADNKISIPNDKFDVPHSFVLIDTRPSTKPSQSIDFEGGTFCGILWIIGGAKFSGNIEDFRGAIFVDGEEGDVTPLTGTPTFEYDPTCITDAIDHLMDTGLNFDHKIISWRELQQSEL